MPLFLIADAGGRRVLERNGPVLTFGRSPGCSVVLPDRDLALLQFEIRSGQDDRWLADLAGDNGTRLNGVPASLSILKAGDRITAGRTEIVYEPSPVDLGTAGMAAVFAGGGVAGSRDEAGKPSGIGLASGGAGPGSPDEKTGGLPHASTPEAGDRRRRLRGRWLMAGVAWSVLVAAVIALYAMEEGSTFSIGPFAFRRGSTEQLHRNLLLCLGAVVVIHLAALGFWFAARRLSGPDSPGRASRGTGRASPPAGTRGEEGKPDRRHTLLP
jgi:hypothetical protein